MTNQELLEEYAALVPFLSDVLGKGCEVVLHDLSDPKHSIVAIANSVSGRKIGDAMTRDPGWYFIRSCDRSRNQTGKET